MDFKAVGQQIRERRLALGLDDFQQAAERAGVTQSVLDAVEKGRTQNPATIGHIVIGFGGSIHGDTITWFPPPWDPPTDPVIYSGGPVA